MKKKLLLILILPLLISCNNKKQTETTTDTETDADTLTETETSSETESGSEDIPAGFYDYDGYYDKDLSWNNSEDLVNKLHTLISTNYSPLQYEGNWSTNQGADQDLYDHESVNLLYSDDTDLKTNTFYLGNGWQREHAFAASLMTGFTTSDAVGVGRGRATDFHNLFAAGNSGNASRGNKNFGIANKNAEDGSYQDKGSYSFDSKNFEPSNEDKGLLSRAIMYMSVMYNVTESATVKVTLNYNEQDQATYGKKYATVDIPVTYKPLTLKEEYVPYSKVTYTNWYYQNDVYGKDAEGNDVLITDVSSLVEQYGEGPEGYALYSMDNCEFAIGNKSTLISWASEYKVSQIEMQHNNYVYKLQKNRNPFVDFPELIDYVYGNKKDEAGNLKDLNASYNALKMNVNEISHYALESADREFDIESTIDHDNFKIVKINNNLTKGDYYDTRFSYTFNKDDAALGYKVIEIPTPINTIKFKVKVNADPINSCSYIHVFDPSAAKGHPFNGYVNGSVMELDGVKWTFTASNSSFKFGSSSNFGLSFGTSTAPTNGLVVESVDSFTVDKLFIKACCAANKTITYALYVGDRKVDEGNITRVTGQTDSVIVGDSLEEAINGKIRIVLGGEGASSGAVILHTLAFNQEN